jgi:serine/threonine protein kinase
MNNFVETAGLETTISRGMSSTATASTGSQLPFAQINIKTPARQKALKLSPPAQPLSATFTTLRPGAGTLHRSDEATSLTRCATALLVECFAACDASFAYDKALNPRRVLTKPSRPIHNNGHDNEKWDYILYVNDVIGNEEGRKYVILDLLGQGTFGQVVKCINVKTRELCAVKVIKNQPAYFNQSMMEVTVLEMLNQKYDRDDRRHIVRMRDTFIFRQHLCIVVELLSLNLYELIKQNGYRGFSLGLCRVFLAQTLDALTVLKEARIIHCDLKPENILLRSLEAPIIKVIDYGSACHEHQTVYTYIQSRFYRAPEIILGLPYTSSIDMWSVGCIAAELFLGLPVFPGCSNYDQISRVVESLGLPPQHMLEMGKETGTYFDRVSTPSGGRAHVLKTRERYAFETGRAEPPPKKYFATTTFPEIILSYPMRGAAAGREPASAERELELVNRRCFADFVAGLLNLNPLERWNPYQAMQHPFITGKAFAGPFQPTFLPLLQSVPIRTPPPTHVHPHLPTAQAPLANAIPQAAMYPNTSSTVSPPTAAAASLKPKGTSRARPRSNTLATLSSFQQDVVPPQLQRLATAARGQPPPPPPGTHRALPTSGAAFGTSVESVSLFPEPSLPNPGQTVGARRSSAHRPVPGSSAAANAPGSPTQSPAAPLQAHQRLSAYVSNRRVSNPAGMFSYAAAQAQQTSHAALDSHPVTVAANYFPNVSGQAASLPTSTGFFYYNNIAAPHISGTAAVSPLASASTMASAATATAASGASASGTSASGTSASGTSASNFNSAATSAAISMSGSTSVTSPSSLSMGRRHSLRGSSQLSMSSISETTMDEEADDLANDALSPPPVSSNSLKPQPLINSQRSSIPVVTGVLLSASVGSSCELQLNEQDEDAMLVADGEDSEFDSTRNADSEADDVVMSSPLPDGINPLRYVVDESSKRQRKRT